MLTEQTAGLTRYSFQIELKLFESYEERIGMPIGGIYVGGVYGYTNDGVYRDFVDGEGWSHGDGTHD